MPSTIDNATGMALVFVTSAFATKLTNLKHTGIGRVAIDKTNHASSSWREFIPGDLQDPGEIEFEGYYNPDEQPPSGAVPETIRMTFPLQTGQTNNAKIEATGFVTMWDVEGELEEMIKVKGKVKLSGAITFTDAS